MVVVAVMALVPAAAQAAAITGTVSDETTHAGIAGVEVCPTPQPYVFEVDCVQTDSGGHYYVGGLAPTQYKISFSAWLNNLPYVSEQYDNKPMISSGDLFTLSSPEEVRQLDVELAQGGSIGGTLTDEDGGAPVASMAACARDDADTYERCTKSDSAGNYQINGLPSGEYSVWYESWNQANYLHEFYEDEETWAQATRVTVTAPEVTTGIDAKLAKGAELLGHVSDIDTGAPLYDVMVCAAEVAEPHEGGCNWTDTSGDYAIRGLPAGSYRVAFGVFSGPFTTSAGQWWDGAASIGEADPLDIAPPESRSGIDAALPGWYGSPLPGSDPAPAIGEETLAPPPLQVQKLPVIKKAPLPKCRKGFHRKLVKGKKRCVRKRQHHGRRHRSSRA
ncbi:MAG TPA: hypothetical protein VFP17_01580 [Solirubrobacterales bacterium]|nr:hypothetical protein [Solirubrobacterales bacterium]